MIEEEESRQPSGRLFHALARRLRLTHPLRIAVQTAGGAAVAFAAAKGLGITDVSWVVFSAVFVVQSSLGGTIRSAVSRMAGGGAGLLIGLIGIFMLGSGGWSTFLGLVGGVAAMSALSAVRPGLSYGLVTVTMLVLAPGVEVVEGSLMKAGEIALGTLCGAAAAAAVMPRAAHRQVDRHLADALDAISQYIGQESHQLGGRRTGHRLGRAVVETHLAQARDMLGQSQPRLRVTGAAVRARDELRREIERFWHEVVLLDQLADPFPNLEMPSEMREPLEHLTGESAERLRRVGVCIASRQPLDPWETPKPALQSLDECSKKLSTRDRSIEQIQHLFALTFTCKQLVCGVALIDEKAREVLELTCKSRGR